MGGSQGQHGVQGFQSEIRREACGEVLQREAEGFDHEPEELTSVNQEIRQISQQKAEWEREIGFTTKKADTTKDNNEAQRLYAHADNLLARLGFAL